MFSTGISLQRRGNALEARSDEGGWLSFVSRAGQEFSRFVRDALERHPGVASLRVPYPWNGASDYFPVGGDCLLAVNRNFRLAPGQQPVAYMASQWAILRVRLSGSFQEEISEDSLTAREGNGSLLYFGSGCRYGINFSAGPPVSSVSLLFHPDLIKRRVTVDPEKLLERLRGEVTDTRDYPHLIVWPGDGTLQAVAVQIMALDMNSGVSGILAEGLGWQLFARAMTLLGRDTTAEERAVRLRAEDIEQLGGIRELLESDFTSHHTLQSLSRRAGINRRKLTEGFRSLFGTSVGDYILNRRIQQACLLLRDGASVGDVAECVGYKDQGSFSRAFKRVVGVRPRDFAE